MDPNHKDQTAKLIGYGVGAVIAYYVLIAIWPYLVMVLALCGAWYVYEEYQKNNRRDRH